MGLGRFLWRATGIGHHIDTIKNIIDEGNIIDGVKKTVKQDIYEDNPVTGAIYKAGTYDGKIEGYVEASNEYEQKLIEQADMFLNQIENIEKCKAEYETLLDEYEKAIDELSDKNNKTEEENRLLNELLLRERKLKKMK